jgi:CPA1 family monovalent cation:H+ antiporter
VPPGITAIIAGESLFKDGVGIVLYTIFLGLAAGGRDAAELALASAVLDFLREGGGGAALGSLQAASASSPCAGSTSTTSS